MKYLGMYCSVAIRLFFVSALDAASKKAQIILCMGQSNMVGRASMPADALKPIPRGALLNAEGKCAIEFVFERS